MADGLITNFFLPEKSLLYFLVFTETEFGIFFWNGSKGKGIPYERKRTRKHVSFFDTIR